MGPERGCWDPMPQASVRSRPCSSGSLQKLTCRALGTVWSMCSGVLQLTSHAYFLSQLCHTLNLLSHLCLVIYCTTPLETHS